jgi:hypothetical protein
MNPSQGLERKRKGRKIQSRERRKQITGNPRGKRVRKGHRNQQQKQLKK